MSDREIVLEVTQTEYEAMLAKKIDAEAILKPGKHRFKRTTRVAAMSEPHQSNTEVEVTIKLDLDVLDYFKKRADAPDAVSYQAQINHELRAIMESEQKAEVADEIENRLLTNKNFISALAAELKKVA